MARVAKIDNVWKKRFERQEKKRAIAIRDERVYFLIVCEGEKTEPNYFEALKKELPIGTVEIKIDGTGRNTISLVEYTIKQKDIASRKYDRVWAVFDKNSFPDNNFNSAIIKARDNNVNCAWTNEAFELWFILHFQYRNTGMKRKEYQDCIEQEIQSRSGDKGYKYKKNDPNTYSLLKKYGNQEQAIKWAKKLQQNFTDERYAAHNPCTRVHELIEELFNPKEILKTLER
ncbi:MAG: RloB domain-containing protein [Bacteroidetes bacterium]|nr:RloB domain-containing protein [Bacteroidota bacterium]